ncbi:MAG: hypothetical protein PHV74_07015 [Dehalococcoidia bacterium]|nr:hypothetical protein [Dehalococcoidia bacterium]
MSLRQMLLTDLPMNRKERFFTGTVFPMIVCKDNFKHISILFSLLGNAQKPPVIADVAQTNIEFFTEYSLKESATGDTRRRFVHLPQTKDTPDIVLLINGTPRTLIAFEAKMYDVPSVADLNQQMAAQEAILDAIREALKIDTVHHFALLPEPLAEQMDGLQFPILTWEALQKAYEPVCRGDYFFEMLGIALEMYDKLVARRSGFGLNCEEKIPGEQIYDGFRNGTLNKSSMGRYGGFKGDQLKQDIVSARWRTFQYETSSKDSSQLNRNWFNVADFVNLIESSLRPL